MRNLCIIVSCSLLAAGCAEMSPQGGSDHASAATTKGAGARVMTGGSPTTDKTYSDTTFIREAAQAGLAEVRMGQLTAQKAQDQALKTFGQELVTDHTQANEELMRIALQKGVAMPMNLSPTDDRVIQRLSAASGEEFDQMAAKEAVQAHHRAIELFELASQKSQDAQVRDYAKKTLPKLRQHLEHAQDLAKNVSSEAQGGTTDREESIQGQGSKESERLESPQERDEQTQPSNP